MKKNTSEQLWRKYHNLLRNQLTMTIWSFQIYTCLANLYAEYDKEFEWFPHFFQFTINAHMLATVMLLDTFFDKTEAHLYIRYFLEFIKEHIDIFSDEAYGRRLRMKGHDASYVSHFMKNRLQVTPKVVEDHIKEVNDLPVGNMRTWRNLALVHENVDDLVNSPRVEAKYPVRTAHIKKTIDKLHEKLNYYSTAYDGSSWSGGIDIGREVRTILNTLRQRQEVCQE